MFDILLIDLDDTILDFHMAERVALTKTLRELGVAPTEHLLSRYHILNQLHWQMLERGELTREQVIVERFAALFRELGLDVDARQCAQIYEGLLGVGHYFLPGAQEAIHTLAKKYRMFLASNGTASVQYARLKSAGIRALFEGVFISQEMGAHKPSRAYYAAVAAAIPGFDPARALMVGDSLTSDILGGWQAGMRTCWINPSHSPRRADIPVDYELESLAQLPAFLEALEQA